MLEIKLIDRSRAADINLPNEAFPLWGRMIPIFDGKNWSHKIEKFPQERVSEMTFPDEHYDFDAMSREHIFLGAYLDGRCVGNAILRRGFFKFMYLYDLKVCRDFRERGIARALIQKSLEIARGNGFCGLYTQGQDNNLSACLFYLSVGFRIGGLDTNVYHHTPQAGKSDIIFYLD